MRYILLIILFYFLVLTEYITFAQSGSSYYINKDKIQTGNTTDSGINCAGGEIHDDGTFEGGVGWAYVTTDGRFVSKFTPSSYPWKYYKFCLALGKYWNLTNSEFRFDIVVYDNTGDSGKPGNLVWHLDSLFVTGIPNVPTYQWYSFSNLDIPMLNNGSYYIGIKFNPSQNNYQKYSGCDLNGTPWPGYYWSNFQPYWTPIEQGFPIGFKALSYRMEGTPPVSINGTGTRIPNEYFLSQNYPNPFNPLTVIEYFLPGEVNVSLKVYDILGNEITTLVDKKQTAGLYEIEFNADALSSGLYVYILEAGSYRIVKKMMLIK
jgi:hypothetical protein